MDGNALTWTKSSYSGDGGGNCLEVVAAQHTVHIRDSKHTAGPVLSVPSRAWSHFLAHAAPRGD